MTAAKPPEPSGYVPTLPLSTLERYAATAAANDQPTQELMAAELRKACANLPGAHASYHRYSTAVSRRRSEATASPANIDIPASVMRLVRPETRAWRNDIPEISDDIVIDAMLDSVYVTMAAKLMNRLCGYSHDPMLMANHWAEARSLLNPRTGYIRWDILMKDGSMVEVNPAPADQPGECWLWAVCYEPESDRVCLIQGSTTLDLYEACQRQLHQQRGATP